MNQKRIEITVPEEMVPFVLPSEREALLRRNAMLLYPYVQDCTISHGKAAEILGISKLDLIALYGKLGLDYLTEKIDLTEDIKTVKRVREKCSINCSGEKEKKPETKSR